MMIKSELQHLRVSCLSRGRRTMRNWRRQRLHFKLMRTKYYWKARYWDFLLKCLTIWIPLTSVIYDSFEHFLSHEGTLISINGMLVIAVHGNVPVRRADNLESCIDLVETAIYKAPQINGCWIRFPCFTENCTVDLIMEVYSNQDPPYQLFHEGDFHWCTYTPKQTYQILSRNANHDEDFKESADIIKQLNGTGSTSNWTMFMLNRKAFK